MENLITINKQTPIEIALQIGEDGTTTARKLYEFLELAPTQFARWSKKNIEKNEYYEENKDWWGFDTMSNGNKCKDYRLTTDFAKHLSMESHSAQGKIARQYFITVEQKAKEMVQSQYVDRSKLSKNMQMFYMLADTQAQIELEQKRQAEQIDKIEERVESIKESVQPITDNWRDTIKHKITKIQANCNYNFQEINNFMYQELEKRAGCDLNRRLRNRKQALYDRGRTKTEIKNTRKIDIVEEDKKLREIFTKIVSEWELRYCA